MFLYACTIFLSAFLLFQIQPMIAKIILPWFGGSAAVWITAMLFFQMTLLGGYLYAHWSIRSSKPKMRATLHVILLLASLAFLPVWPTLAWRPTGTEEPILNILGLLTMSVGLPYFLLSTTSPLIQAWYSAKHRAALPYRLFALSNLASLLGLLAYPFLIEPNVTLRQQSIWWSTAYVFFIVFCIISSFSSLQGSAAETSVAAGASLLEDTARRAPALREQLLCLLLACCASTLMLSVTNHLTQNVASIPFLWVLPLSLYLLSFVLTFDQERLYSRKTFFWLLSFTLLAMSYALLNSWNVIKDTRLVIVIFCAGLLICCTFCHGEVVKRKPVPRHLTSFYLMLSAGGALGGLLVGIVAPLVLPGNFELPMAMIACAILLFIATDHRGWLYTCLCVLVALEVISANCLYIVSLSRNSRAMSRNFYGSLRVIVSGQGTREENRILINGVINHGNQYTEPNRRREQITYYRPQSGVALALQSLRPSPLRVGIIGLGAGALASFAEPGDLFRFYEINPQVEKVARTEFTYLADCKGKLDIVIGDGRLAIEGEQPQNYDILVVDAFSSDAIPVHLLSVQALQLYFKNLVPDGILALHITNAHLDLEPIVEMIGKKLGKYAVVVVDKGQDGRDKSRWALLTSKPVTTHLITKVAARLESRPELRIWTDDYNNLFQILK